MEIFIQILIAGGIMLAVALVFGVILVICSNVFAVRKDERIEQVENLLAKSNCGGCGRAGCAQFAEALIKGEAKLSDCKATPAASSPFPCAGNTRSFRNRSKLHLANILYDHCIPIADGCQIPWVEVCRITVEYALPRPPRPVRALFFCFPPRLSAVFPERIFSERSNPLDFPPVFCYNFSMPLWRNRQTQGT